MIGPEKRKRIRDLRKRKSSIRRIAKTVGVSRNTVRKILKEKEVQAPARGRGAPKRGSLLDPYKEEIRKLLQKARENKWKLPVKRIYKEIRKQGYRGGRTLVDEYVRELRGPSRRARKVHPRFETWVAEEAQQDWSPYRVKIGAKMVIIQLFSLILAWSRYQFFRAYLNQKLPALLYGHVAAFHYFEGVPWKIVYDQQRTITPYAIDGEPVLTEKFAAFVEHYGFGVHICAPGHKERKGKIERPFQLFETSFLPLRTFASLEDLNRQLIDWLDGVEDPEEGNHRVHNTTREIPYERWLEEKAYLYELPATDSIPRRVQKRRVWKDATISVEGNRYSVPARLAERRDRTVWISIGPEDFLVHDEKGAIVARHELRPERGAPIILESHYADLQRRRNRGRQPELERQFLKRFPGGEGFLHALKEALGSIAPIHLRKIFALARRYRVQEVQAALWKALADDTPTAGYVTRILSVRHPTGHLGDLYREPPKGLSLGAVDPGNTNGYEAIFEPGEEGSDDDAKHEG